ncbi:FAD-dependent oxidoreductase [Luteitalea sp. TBR-22]|uniref:FAD-dependent oxidoreductase n=1 Tax=Luteitalea sp. TBR-22 TaxID=2802971 RepID=UPI001EF4C723|nr:FAD-dependent oxidoreductase [Luteitalea sp. TBR-22]
MPETQIALRSVGTPDRIFPTLTPAQVARIAAHGHRRPIAAGQRLVEVGQAHVPFYVVLTGAVQILRSSGSAETLIVTHRPGAFLGEASMIAGRRSLVRALVSEPGEVLEVEREQLLRLVQTDAELGDIVMRAFILRRVELIAHGLGDAVVIGSNHCASTLRLKAFLIRNGHPFGYIDLDHDADAQEMLERFQVSLDDVPVLICRGETVLRNPTNQQVAECLGFNEAIDQARVRDVVVIGAGPAGLAAAVYAASEGLDVLVAEANAPGGQAGTSSRIENYLGFPNGIAGQELTDRAHTQALKFGAQVVVAKGATELAGGPDAYAVRIDGGPPVPARAVVIATGAEYRKPPVDDLPRFEGAGVYYAATPMEAQVCTGEDVVVIGGGNSAGQAAVFLAQTARHVHMLVRGDGLTETMSRYLIRRIEDHERITLHTRSELAWVRGSNHLEAVGWRGPGGEIEVHAVGHVFVMAGALPNTAWLEGRVALDPRGFIRTGPDLTPEDLAAASWPLARPPYLLETSRPGVFAVGDVRSGNSKRVASAVGEGSNAIAFVHQYLRT